MDISGPFIGFPSVKGHEKLGPARGQVSGHVAARFAKKRLIALASWAIERKHAALSGRIGVRVRVIEARPIVARTCSVPAPDIIPGWVSVRRTGRDAKHGVE
jgi:hypothetical protein